METTTTQNQATMEQLIEALKAVTAGGRRIVGHFGDAVVANVQGKALDRDLLPGFGHTAHDEDVRIG